MSKKHFQALADNLRACRPDVANADMTWMWNRCVEQVATACHSQNSGFKFDTFYAACGGLF